MLDLKKLIENGVHFGHQKWRWCPKMKPYIWGSRNDIHLIDISKTAVQAEKAAQFLKDVASQGKPILWVGTKKAAQKAIDEVAQRLGSPYVTHRWVGGTLTNWPQVKKSITKLMHYEDVLARADEHLYTKKERGLFQKMVDRHIKNVGGIRTLKWPVGALVVVDVKKEHTVIREAAAAGVPVVALVDTNSDPSYVDFVIPANDDIPRSISLIVNYLADAVAVGKAEAADRPQEELADSSLESIIETALGAEDEEEKAAAKKRRGRTVPAGRTRSRTPSSAPRSSR